MSFAGSFMPCVDRFFPFGADDDGEGEVKQSFSVLCARHAARYPYMKWSDVCKAVSAGLRPKKPVPVVTQQIRLPYKD